MYTFYKQGNSLEVLFQWLKDSYGTDASALMSGFIKKYKNNTLMMQEFNRTCFI